ADHLPFGHRRGHQHLDRARAQLLAHQAHGQHRAEQQQHQPGGAEEVAERRAPRGARIVHLADEIDEDDAVDRQEEEQHHVGDRREEVRPQLAPEGRQDAVHDATSCSSSTTGPAAGGVSTASCVVRRTKMSSIVAPRSRASSSSTQPRSTAVRNTASRGSLPRSHSSSQEPPPAPSFTPTTPGSPAKAAPASAGASLSATRTEGLPIQLSRRLSGVPSATILPRSMITTRSHSSSTS